MKQLQLGVGGFTWRPEQEELPPLIFVFVRIQHLDVILLLLVGTVEYKYAA